MTLPEALELVGALLLVAACGLLVAVLWPSLWPLGLAVAGAGCLLLASIIERARGLR